MRSERYLIAALAISAIGYLHCAATDTVPFTPDGGGGAGMIDASPDATSHDAGMPDCASTCGCPPDMMDVNGDGSVCRFYPSCKALKAADPKAPDGLHTIDPDGQGAALPFIVYCDMTQNGGGWTLVFNAGTSFLKSSPGVEGVSCFNNSDCTSRAYSTVPISADLMLDAADTPISGMSQSIRTVILGVDPLILGKTLHSLVNTQSNSPVELQDDSNVTHTFASGYDCNSWAEYTYFALCNKAYRLVLNDTMTGCGTAPFVLGDTLPGNCSGWPGSPDQNGSNFWPDYFRVWVR